ncbi:MAG: hypothetical protein HY775_04565 [Acidobacteria bacterium]|nr:hypothetical protein [Acidobacteriota bacterium]
MSTLHVRNVPAEIYEDLRRVAASRRTSISAEAIRILRRAMRVDRAGVRELLDEVDADRPVARRGAPSAASLIREDRDAR